jgi:hypothetical protein
VSLPIVNAVWRMKLRHPSMRLVLLKLADCADASGTAWPSVHTLADATGLSTRTVIRALAGLASGGLIEIEANKNPNNHRSNRYRIPVEKWPKRAVSGDTTSSKIVASSDTLSLRQDLSSDSMSPSQATNATFSSDILSVSSDILSKPPGPPYRKNHPKEPSYEPGEGTIEEAVNRIAITEPSLRSDPVIRALTASVEAELRNGMALDDLVKLLLARWRKYSTARDQGKFEIHGWGPLNFFAGGHWKDEQSWQWKPEFRPEPKMRYVNPSTLYSGPEYQRAVSA